MPPPPSEHEVIAVDPELGQRQRLQHALLDVRDGQPGSTAGPVPGQAGAGTGFPASQPLGCDCSNSVTCSRSASGLLFHTATGRPLWHEHYGTRVFGTAVKRAELPAVSVDLLLALALRRMSGLRTASPAGLRPRRRFGFGGFDSGSSWPGSASATARPAVVSRAAAPAIRGVR
ncbi:MAG: hypothetical protein ACRDTE_08570 [Pseudonocardiaceae bacterium]